MFIIEISPMCKILLHYRYVLIGPTKLTTQEHQLSQTYLTYMGIVDYQYRSKVKWRRIIAPLTPLSRLIFVDALSVCE